MSAKTRIESMASHISASGVQQGKLSHKAIAPKSPDDVGIGCALRSALTKGGKGGFKDTHPEYIMAKVLEAVIKKTGIDPKIVKDIQGKFLFL